VIPRFIVERVTPDGCTPADATRTRHALGSSYHLNCAPAINLFKVDADPLKRGKGEIHMRARPTAHHRYPVRRHALIAQTGSVLLTARSGGGRALSVLPPHHVVIARREQLLPDLPAAYALLHKKYGPASWPSMITLITGPSRTGDIERILVLGAHGPKKLTVILTDH